MKGFSTCNECPNVSPIINNNPMKSLDSVVLVLGYCLPRSFVLPPYEDAENRNMGASAAWRGANRGRARGIEASEASWPFPHPHP